MTTKQTLQQAASNERSVSQERAFIRGAGYATAKACTWLESRLPLTNLSEFLNEFKNYMAL